MKTSVVIPAWNNLALTTQCLASLRETAPAAEVILVDNGSTDGTEESVRQDFPEVAVLRFSENRGFAPACNAGANIAGGDVVVFVNNDVIAHPGWLEPLVEALEDPSITIVGSLLLYPNGTVQHAGMTVLRSLQFVHVHQGLHPDSVPGVRRAKDLQCVTGACLAIRYKDFLELGEFDETYINGFEDVDLCMRARKAGGRVRYEPRSVLTHLEGQTEGRLAKEFLNIRTFYAKWRGFVRFDHDRIVAEDMES